MMLAQASSGLNNEKLDIEDIFKVMKNCFSSGHSFFLTSLCSFSAAYLLLFSSGVRPEWRWTNFWRRAQADDAQSWRGTHRRRGEKNQLKKKKS